MAVGQELAGWERLFAARTRSAAGDAIAAIMALANRTDIISFCGGIPDPVTFPGDELAEILRELVAADPTAFQYTPTAGLESLRDYLSDRLEALDGRRPGAEQLMVTSGGIDALELIGKAFLDAGDLVIVEGPSYLGSIMSFLSFEARVVAVPLDDDGLDVGALERVLATGPLPKVVYTIPDFQNPSGVTLAADRRVRLVELARRYGFLLVEDVCYRELSFGGEQPPTMRGQAPDCVVQIGTFSKTFFPGVRLGWAAGPAGVVAKLVWAKQNTDQCSGALGQRLLEEYGRRGHLDARIAEARRLYAHRADRTIGALEEVMPPGVRWTRPTGGFYTWLTLPAGLDASVLAERAMEERVAFVPGAPFYPDGSGRESLRISFSRASDDEIEEGMRRLGRLFTSALYDAGAG